MTAPHEDTPASEPAADDLTAAGEIAQLEDRWRRALADLDNLRKRCAREIAAERTAEQARVLAAWLPVLDNLDRALAHAGEQGENLIEGVRAVRDQAIEVLAAMGYPRDDETGVRFDPARHEAVTVSSGTGVAPGTIMAVARPGYGLGDRQLRPASVVVAGRDE
jgi:molecular chaperone GrpE